ncbi:MAG TPA: alpha/beta hydrolase [Herpetosiphonaceae bacterium]
MTQQQIQAAGGEIFCEERGDGPALVLIHPGFADSRVWDGQWAALAGRFRAIRYDQRGFGRSQAAAGPVDRRAELAGVLDALDVSSAILVGCSQGGEIALDFALERPERVAALALVSTVPSGFELQGEPPAALLELFAALEQGELEQAAELQVRLWLDGAERQPGELPAALRRQVAELGMQGLTGGGFGQEDERPLQPPAAGRLGEVRAPTLVVAGALDHPEVLRGAATLAAGIAGARELTLPGYAHLPMLEQPERFNRALLEFLGATELRRGA